MAEPKNTTPEVAHDRVVMLSLLADGTPDQINPVIIGDKEFAIEAVKRQFAEQAVSAADDAKGAGEPLTEAEAEKIAAAAEKKAASAIEALSE